MPDLPAPRAVTAKQAQEIILSWASGAKYAEACIAAGLTKEAAKAMKADPDWVLAYEGARAAFVAGSLRSIQEHGKADWKASAWLLERIVPERFSKRESVDVNVKMQPLPWTSILSGKIVDAEVVPSAQVEAGSPVHPDSALPAPGGDPASTAAGPQDPRGVGGDGAPGGQDRDVQDGDDGGGGV